MDHILLLSSSQCALGEVRVELVAIELLLWGKPGFTLAQAFCSALPRSAEDQGLGRPLPAGAAVEPRVQAVRPRLGRRPPGGASGQSLTSN